LNQVASRSRVSYCRTVRWV